ncbi:hypothetical protein [Bacillus cytotoxicus]|uniref:hypothetical protein n=1 Tax=Bacillus cytotoxicus TaxID=580165 RepID=UPI002448C624|nr:hypothetical protein [Bacillus cytotoxicus]MDH2882514.1 hypothetical protein [Bacillus cytotoxicus]
MEDIKIINVDNRSWEKTKVGDNPPLLQDVMAALEDKVEKDEEKKKKRGRNIHSNLNEKYYYKLFKTGEDTYQEEVISNFIIIPLYTAVNSFGKQIYTLKLVSSIQSKVVEFDGETLAIHTSFKKHCMNSGRFNWFGDQSSLNSLISEILSSSMKEIEIITCIGWNEREKAWFFPRHAFYNGDVSSADENGIITLKDKHFKVQVDQNTENLIFPLQNSRPSKEELALYFKCLKILYGNYGLLAFGYITSTFNVDAITSSRTDYFPFLYFYAMYGRGKSSFMKVTSSFAGMKVPLDTMPSKDVLRKGLSKHSSLPFIVDEAENKNDSGRGVDFFKTNAEAIKNNIYMRQDFTRGHKDEDKIIYYPVKGTLMLGGEVLTSVASIIQRSVLIDASKLVFNEEVYQQFRGMEKISVWTGQYLMRTSEEWKDHFIRLYDEIMTYFTNQGWTSIHIRIRTHYAIFLAGALAAAAQLNKYFDGNILLSSKEELKGIYQFVYQEMKETQLLTTEDHPSMEFLRKIGLLANKEAVRRNIDYKCITEKDGTVYLYLAPTNVYEAYRISERTPFYPSSKKVVKDLQNYSFFKVPKKQRIGQSNPTAWVIQLSDPKNPSAIKNGIVHPELPDTMIYFYK